MGKCEEAARLRNPTTSLTHRWRQSTLAMAESVFDAHAPTLRMSVVRSAGTSTKVNSDQYRG